MNPEGKQTPNTSSSLDARIKKALEERDQTRASQNSAGQTSQQNQSSLYLPGETAKQFEQRMLAAVASGKMKPDQLANLKKKSPHLFPPSQTQKPPSASTSSPSPN